MADLEGLGAYSNFHIAINRRGSCGGEGEGYEAKRIQIKSPRGDEFSLVSLNVMADVGFGFGHRMQDVPIKVSRDNRNTIHHSKLARG